MAILEPLECELALDAIVGYQYVYQWRSMEPICY